MALPRRAQDSSSEVVHETESRSEHRPPALEAPLQSGHRQGGLLATRNALASVRLSYSQQVKGGPYHVTIQVWSHSYDHPDAGFKNAVVDAVYLTHLPPSPNYGLTNVKITDRYGIDETLLWMPELGVDVGFVGYVELDTASPCRPGFPNVLWGAFTGVYDERCLADAACDARRLQTHVVTLANPPGRIQLAAYNYLIGPVTFAFDIALSAAPTAVRLRMGHVGGNGGNPAQLSATLPNEEFVIRFP